MSLLGDILGIGETALEYQKFEYEKSKDAHLTGAQIQQNEFAHNEAQLAYERELAADSTKYQRQVQDLQAAGLNPMLAVSQSAGSVHSSPASPGTPASSSLGGISLGAVMNYDIQRKQLAIQRELADAQIKNIEADTEQKKTSTEGQALENSFFRDTLEVRQALLGDEHAQYSWKRDLESRDVATRERAQAQLAKQSEAYIDLLDEQRVLVGEQVKSEPFKRMELAALAKEARASATYKAAMMEVDQELARSTSEEKREQASLLRIEARMKNGLYTEKYIEDVAKAVASDAEVKALVAAYKKGDYSAASKDFQKMLRKLEHDGQLGTYSVSSPYFGMSNNAAAAAGTLVQ